MGWEGADLGGVGKFLGNKSNNRRIKALKTRLEQSRRPDGSIDYDALDAGVADSYGGSLAELHNGDSVESQQALARGEYLRSANREAGRMVVDDASNISGARQRMSNELLRSGDFEGGLAEMERGDRAFTGRQAIQRAGPSGEPDAAVLAGGVATNDAKYGRIEAGQGSGEQSRQVRMKMARGLTGQLLTKLSNPEMYDADSIAASANAMFDYVPEFGSGLDAKVTTDGKVYLYRGEEFVAPLDGSKETLQFLNTFSTDPEKTMETVVAGMQKDSETAKTAAAARQKTMEDTLAKGADALLKADLLDASRASAVSKVIASSTTNMRKAGWEPKGTEITDPVSGYVKQMIVYNGEEYEMLRKGAEPGSDPAAPKTSVIFRTTGANPQEVNLGGEPGADSAIAYMTAMGEVENAARRTNNLGAYKQYAAIIQTMFGATPPAAGGAPAGGGRSAISSTGDPYDTVYGDTASGNKFGFQPPKPISQMTIGEATDYGKTTMIPATKGKIGRDDDLGTSAVGAYQFVSSTLPGVGQKVFGAGWRDVPMTPANQDAMAKQLFEDGKSGNLQAVWEGLPNTRAGAYKDYSWDQMRAEIFKHEIGVSGPAMGAADTAPVATTVRGAIPSTLSETNPIGDQMDAAVPVPAAPGASPTATAAMDPEAARAKARGAIPAQQVMKRLGDQAVAKVPEMQAASKEYIRMRDRFATFQAEKGLDGDRVDPNLLSPADRIEYSLLTAAVNSAKGQFESLLRDTQQATATSVGYTRGVKKAIARKAATAAGTAQFEKRTRQ